MRLKLKIVSITVGAIALLMGGCQHSAERSLPEHPPLAPSADVKLPRIFGNHMVLQSGMRVPIWGCAAPGEHITVQFEAQSQSTVAGADGSWQLALAPLPADERAQHFTVTGDHGDLEEFADVLVGEVWIGSGQSNMGFQVKQEQGAAELIKEADEPTIHLFTVRHTTAKQPLGDVDGQWVVCSKKSLPEFSAVLAHFGFDLHKRLGVPVGLIHTSWGGTPIQCWIPRAGFADEDLNKLMAKVAATRPAPWPTTPMVLYNAMIAPITGYACRGMIWYQGESNNTPQEAPKYGQRMRTMITLWRSAWGEGDFPFYFVQIAPYALYKTPETLPILWQQQIWVAEHVPNTDIAPISDIGNLKNIHPTNKREVGRRLAMIALAKTYGQKDLVHQGPRFSGDSIEGQKIRVFFSGTDGGLKTSDGQAPRWFEIAGDDGRFTPANAKIDGGSVVVWSNKINAPRYVRLGWDQTAELNLCNDAGWPALMFDSRKMGK